MYINFKNKYKKFFWLLVGFMLSCIYAHKVSAAMLFENYNFDNFEFNFNNISYNKNKLFAVIEDQLQINNKSLNDYKYISVTVPTAPQSVLGDTRNKIIIGLQNFKPTCYYSGTGFNQWFWAQCYADVVFPQEYFEMKISLVDGTISSQIWEAYQDNSVSIPWVFSGNSWGTAKVYSNIDFSILPNLNSNPINVYTQFYYDSNMLETTPTYLQGYKKVDLTTDDRYVMISDVTSGSVFIPTQAFNDYGGRLSYYDNDLNSQPYTSYIQDYTTMPDGQFVRQDFNLDNYPGADFMMFSKYIYLEGQDNISYSIWVPDTSYDSQVTITPNAQGGNNFDFTYKDSNGDIQSEQTQSSDLSQGSPLISDLFTNFSTNDYGLSSIITAPIPLLQTLNNASCSTVDLPLGVFGGVHDQRLSLPCMTPVYSSIFGDLFTLYQTITTGVIAYFIGLAYFNKIKQLKDPDNDSIEVINL